MQLRSLGSVKDYDQLNKMYASLWVGNQMPSEMRCAVETRDAWLEDCKNDRLKIINY